MVNKKENVLLSIETMIRLGNHTQAKRKLSTFVKSTALSSNQKIKVSEFYQRLGMASKGLKILGRELDNFELEITSPEELAVQVKLGYLLHFIGAKYVALRIFNNIDSISKKRNIDIVKYIPEYYKYLSYVYLAAYDFRKAYPITQKAIENLKEINLYQSKFMQLSAAYALSGIGLTEKALNLLTNLLGNISDNETLLLCSCYLERGEIYLNNRQLEKAEIDLEMAEKNMPQEVKTRDKGFIDRCLGTLYLLMGKVGHAEEKLLSSLEIHFATGARPISVIVVLYWLEKTPNYKPLISHKIALRAHLNYSPYSFLSGKTINPLNPIALAPWIQKEYIESNNDCWVIFDNDIKARCYKEVILELYKNEDNELLDLYSGQFRKANDQVLIISKLQVKCLSAIIGGGVLGVNQWSLIDFLYQQDFNDIESGLGRIKNLIKQLKNQGFLIQRTKNHYYLNPPNDSITIIPMSHSRHEIDHFIRSIKKDFTTSDVVELYKVSQSTASRWIKGWNK